jgi:hypothetical protein
MITKSTLIISIIIAAVLGFMTARIFGPNNGAAYDQYGLCIIQCDDKADESKATLQKCLAGLPESNPALCEHLSGQNKIDCQIKEIEKFQAIKKCYDAYDDGSDCRKDCRKWRVEEVQQK